MTTGNSDPPVPKRPARFVQAPRLFVLEIDSKPILAFEARSVQEARELKGEAWLLDDLRRLTSGGRPLWDGKAKLRVGPADGDEVDELQQALHGPPASDIRIAYLLPIDGEGGGGAATEAE
jgi:hypothetical protein